MCRVGQVHVSRAHARPCWLTLSPHSMLGHLAIKNNELRLKSYERKERAWYILGIVLQILKVTLRFGANCRDEPQFRS